MTSKQVAKANDQHGSPKKRTASIQQSLTGPDSRFEHVLNLQQQIGNRATTALLQTSATDTAQTPPVTHDTITDGGRPLDQATQSWMEARLGHDFSDVQVRTDAAAAKSALELSAKAYTVGKTIVFGAGRYAPKTMEGKRLLAHELTHVVQQNQPPGVGHATPQQGESEANQASSQVLQGSAPTIATAAPTGVQCDELDERKKEDCPNCHKANEPKTDWKSLAKENVLSPEDMRKFLEKPAPTKDEQLDKALQDLHEADTHPRVSHVGKVTTPAIKKMPVQEREVPTIRFVTTGTSFFDITAQQFELGEITSTQVGPHPTAGYNFTHYLRNETTGQLIPAQHLGGTRYRVLMGTPECPGCHFGRGLEVDLHGQHPLMVMLEGAMMAQAIGELPYTLQAISDYWAARGIKPPPAPSGPPKLKSIEGGGQTSGPPTGKLRDVSQPSGTRPKISQAANDNAIPPSEPNAQVMKATGTDDVGGVPSHQVTSPGKTGTGDVPPTRTTASNNPNNVKPTRLPPGPVPPPEPIHVNEPVETLPARTDKITNTPNPRTSSTTRTKLIRENLKKEGIDVPENHDVHHIVEEKGGGPLGDRARDLLAEGAVPIHDGANLMPLPTKRYGALSRSATDAWVSHEEMHTQAYLKNLVERLQKTPPTQRQAALRDIRRKIMDDEFAHQPKKRN